MDNKGKGRELPLASPEPLVPVFQKSVNEKLADFLQDYFEDQPTKFKWGDVPKVKYLHVPDPNDPIELLEFTFRENDAEHTVNFTKRQMQTFGLTVEDFLNQKWGCPSIGISLDGEGVSCEWAPGAFQTTDGYGYWRIGEYGERFKCDKYGVKYPENIFDQDPFYDHVAVTVRPDTDNAKELFARIKSQDSKFVLESEAVLLSLKDENGKTICTQGKNRFFIAVEHEPSRMYIDECLRDAYAPNAKRIYNNCTPYNKTEIGYYQKGEHDERIACDISGKVGTTFGSTKTHPARDGTLIYADLTSYGHVLGYHRLGPLNEHIMCGKNGKTGTGLDQARIGRLALAYEMQKTLKDRRIQWTTEFHNLEFKGDYIDSVNALNHSQTVNFPGGQGAPPGPWNPKYNAPLNNFLWKRSDSEEYVIALADMAGDNHCCALSMLKKDNKTSVIYLEPFNATAGLPLRTLRTVASMIGQGAIHYAAAIIKAVQKTPAGCTDFAVDDTQVLETESVKQLFRKMHDNICTGKIIDPDAQYCHDKVSLFPKEEKYPALYALLSKYQEFNPEKEASLLFFQNGTYEVHQEKNVVTIQDEESLKDLRDVLKKRKLEYDFSYISSWKATIDKDEYDFVPGLAAEALPEGLISVRLESKFIPESIAGRAQNVFLVPYNADEPLHIACVERFNDGYLHKLPNSNGHLQVVEGDFLPPVFFNNTTSKTRREEYIRKNKKLTEAEKAGLRETWEDNAVEEFVQMRREEAIVDLNIEQAGSALHSIPGYPSPNDFPTLILERINADHIGATPIAEGDTQLRTIVASRTDGGPFSAMEERLASDSFVFYEFGRPYNYLVFKRRGELFEATLKRLSGDQSGEIHEAFAKDHNCQERVMESGVYEPARLASILAKEKRKRDALAQPSDSSPPQAPPPNLERSEDSSSLSSLTQSQESWVAAEGAPLAEGAAPTAKRRASEASEEPPKKRVKGVPPAPTRESARLKALRDARGQSAGRGGGRV